MKKLALFICLLSLNGVEAQTFELGPFLGGSNVISDVGRTNYIAPNKLAYGLVFKWNLSTRYSYRFSLISTKLSNNDAASNISSRIQRGYDFDNELYEIAAQLEFNFLDFDLHNYIPYWTPYLALGVAYSRYSELYLLNDIEIANTGLKRTTWGIPITAGIKANLTPSIIIAGEVGLRYAFTDDLDGSNPKNPGLSRIESADPNVFGNLNSDDWYVFTGITLTYTFVRKPCFDCAD